MDWWWDLLKAMDAHEGQAAWAQGFFSVMAIVAAAWIASEQARREESRRAADHEALCERNRAASFETITMVVMLASTARSTIEDLKNDLAEEPECAGDKIKLFYPIFEDLRHEAKVFISQELKPDGARQFIFQVRGLIWGTMFVLRGMAARIDLGHALNDVTRQATVGTLTHSVAALSDQIEIGGAILRALAKEDALFAKPKR